MKLENKHLERILGSQLEDIDLDADTMRLEMDNQQRLVLGHLSVTEKFSAQEGMDILQIPACDCRLLTDGRSYFVSYREKE